MPLKCSIPGCRSNYNSSTDKGTYVSVFKFPSDKKLMQSWLENIPRKNWTPLKNSCVCELHFESRFVSKLDEYKNREGNMATFPRKRPILLPDAVPTIFDNVKLNLPRKSEQKRTDPEERRKIVNERSQKLADELVKKDIIVGFSEFIVDYDKHVDPAQWKCETCENEFICYIIDFLEKTPKVKRCIRIDSNMCVVVSKNGYLVAPHELTTWLFTTNMKLNRWSQFEILLNHYSIDSTDTNTDGLTLTTLKENINSNFKALMQYVDHVSDKDKEELTEKLMFLQEQFQLAFDAPCQRRYSPKMIVHALMIHMISPSTYDALRSKSILTLPHAGYLNKLSRPPDGNPTESNSHSELISE